MLHSLLKLHCLFIPIAALLCHSANAQGSIENIHTMYGTAHHVRAASVDGSVAVLSVLDPAHSYTGKLWSLSGGGILDLASGSGLFSTAEVSSCNADGTIAVGWGLTPSGIRAFRWTQATGMQSLGVLVGASLSGAGFVSADGSTIIGSSTFGSIAGGNTHGFVWTSAGGLLDLGDTVRPVTCSFDGSVVVGTMGAAGQDDLFRWTGATGIQALGALPGMTNMLISNVSVDGAVIVGTALGSSNQGSQVTAFRWTASSGLQAIPDFQGGQAAFNLAQDLSADGSIVVGTVADQVNPSRAYRWTAATGAQDLGGFGQPSMWSYSATECSSDGSIVLGRAVDAGTGISYPVRWTTTGGIQQIDTLVGSGAYGSWLSDDGAIVLGASGEYDVYASQSYFRWQAGSSGLGSTYGPLGLPNSSGGQGMISASGSHEITDNDLTLSVSQLPANSFGIFIVGRDYAESPLFAGGQGTLLIGGAFGRFNGGSEIQFSGVSGSFDFHVNLNAIPTPQGRVPVQPGETLFFQAWHRDLNSGPTSNMTNAVAILFH